MTDRATTAITIAQSGGALAKDYFHRLSSLEVVNKGLQDFVTQADQNVELHIRSLIEEAFPADGIIGEEHQPKLGTSGYSWVIDPIDGTANFINAIPAWCVVLAVVKDDATQIGVIHDPIHAETFHAVKGAGATLNRQPLVCPPDTAFNRGSISASYSARSNREKTLQLINEIITRDGVFHRNGSGALSLAYVSAGRLIGFVEEYMHAWDCLAGQLLITEAGGKVAPHSADAMIADGGRVVAASTGIFDELIAITNRIYEP